MATDILVPTLGESVSTATVARWLKKAGEAVAADEPLVELETDKVTVEVNAPAAPVPAPKPQKPEPVPAAAAQPKVEEPRVPAGPVAVPGHAPLPAAAKLM